MIYLDTHVVIWLYAYGATKLSERSRKVIEEARKILISPIVLLEIDLLHEIGRLTLDSSPVYQYISKHIGLEICQKAFTDVVKVAAHLTWTRDPFDRIITAQAALTSSTLITKDTQICQHYKYATW